MQFVYDWNGLDQYIKKNNVKIIDGGKMNLQVGGPSNTIVLTVNLTSVTLIMDVMLYQLGHASMA